MKDSHEGNVFKRLADAYEEILEHALDEYKSFRRKSSKKRDDSDVSPFHEFINNAKEKLIIRGEVTEDEAHKLTGYLKRDLVESVTWMDKTGKEMREWFGYESGVIKAGLLEMFAEAADQTRVDMVAFQHELDEGGQYHTGQYTVPGVLICESCAEKIHFSEVGRIPPCPKCKGSVFFRDYSDSQETG